MTDDRPYKVFSPTKIWMSPTARAWAKEHQMSERDFGQYLIDRHQEAGDPFAHDTGHPAGRSDIEGFAPEALDPFAGDVGVAAGRGDIEGFAPQVLAETASELLDPLAGDVAQHPPGRNQIEGFRADPERHTNADSNAQRIHDAESYWGTKW
jgi:hypothetical protein